MHRCADFSGLLSSKIEKVEAAKEPPAVQCRAVPRRSLNELDWILGMAIGDGTRRKVVRFGAYLLVPVDVSARVGVYMQK